MYLYFLGVSLRGRGRRSKSRRGRGINLEDQTNDVCNRINHANEVCGIRNHIDEEGSTQTRSIGKRVVGCPSLD